MTSLNLELYRKLYLIRKADEAICRHYGEDEMKTPVHLSLGEEAIATGVIHALSPEEMNLRNGSRSIRSKYNGRSC